jgi:hypothetical protein
MLLIVCFHAGVSALSEFLEVFWVGGWREGVDGREGSREVGKERKKMLG